MTIQQCTFKAKQKNTAIILHGLGLQTQIILYKFQYNYCRLDLPYKIFRRGSSTGLLVRLLPKCSEWPDPLDFDTHSVT